MQRAGALRHSVQGGSAVLVQFVALNQVADQLRQIGDGGAVQRTETALGGRGPEDGGRGGVHDAVDERGCAALAEGVMGCVLAGGGPRVEEGLAQGGLAGEERRVEQVLEGVGCVARRGVVDCVAAVGVAGPQEEGAFGGAVLTCDFGEQSVEGGDFVGGRESQDLNLLLLGVDTGCAAEACELVVRRGDHIHDFGRAWLGYKGAAM